MATTSKPVFGFGWIETGLRVAWLSNTLLLNPSSASAGLKQPSVRASQLTILLLNPSSASAGLKPATEYTYHLDTSLLNPSSASAGLKLAAVLRRLHARYASKPVFGFGWIETFSQTAKTISAVASKPVFGFGWIETYKADFSNLNTVILLNPSSASAGLKQLYKLDEVK